MVAIETHVLKFLKELKKNNSKEWFTDHKAEYDKAKLNFLAYVDAVIKELGKIDPTIKSLEAKSCIFRINRDIRFSNDKSPYKTNFGASMNKGGKKSPGAGYYIHLEPGSTFIGGGIWMPPGDVLAKIRQEIDYNTMDFKKAIFNKNFAATYGRLDESEKLSTAPKGYAKDHPEIEYLKLKSFTAGVQVKDADMLKPDSLKNTVNILAALKPVIEFLNKAVE